MATKAADKEDTSSKVSYTSSKVRNNSDNWKFPKIPLHKIYKKNFFRILESYAIKDYEQTIAFQSTDKFKSMNLLSNNFLHGCFINKKHKFLHLGLVQVAIKPLVRDGLETPIIVYLRDSRHHNFKNSLLAVVETNLSQGAFYFNCFPSFSVSLSDSSYDEALTLTMKTTGIPTGVSVALTVRIVCKAMVDLSTEYLEELVSGKTVYFHAPFGTPAITQWDEVVEDNNCVVQRPVGQSSTLRSRTFVRTFV